MKQWKHTKLGEVTIRGRGKVESVMYELCMRSKQDHSFGGHRPPANATFDYRVIKCEWGGG